MELPPFHQPFGDPKYGLMVDTRDGTLLSLPAATREEQLERDRQWELYCQERGDADGVQAMDENDDEEDGGGLPPVPLLEAVRERDREIEIQDPWAEEYAASSQREVVGKKRTAVVPRCDGAFLFFFYFFFLWAVFLRCHFPVCAKSCDVVFYCPSAFPGEDDYPFPFCSPECAASWAEYEIGDTIVWNPQFDVKPATATAIRTAIEARVQRSVRVRDAEMCVLPH